MLINYLIPLVSLSYGSDNDLLIFPVRSCFIGGDETVTIVRLSVKRQLKKRNYLLLFECNFLLVLFLIFCSLFYLDSNVKHLLLFISCGIFRLKAKLELLYPSISKRKICEYRKKIHSKIFSQEFSNIRLILLYCFFFVMEYS